MGTNFANNKKQGCSVASLFAFLGFVQESDNFFRMISRLLVCGSSA